MAFKGKGKGSLYEVTKQLNKVDKKKSKEDVFMENQYQINDRFAKNNSDVVYFKDTCYKATGSATFKGGYSWRCGQAKYHISPDEKDPDTGEHFIFMLIGDNIVKVEGETVEWPTFDQDVYDKTMEGRELISREKWKFKQLQDELTLKMKEDLHYVRSGKTLKRKAEQYAGNKHIGKKGKFQ